MFSLVLFGGARPATSAVSDTHWRVSRAGQSVSQSVEVGEREGERPLSASLLWSSGCQAAAPQRSTSSWAPLDPPSLSQEKASPPKTGQSRLSATHGISNEEGGKGAPPLDPAVVPALSPASQFFDTKITLAGRCNSHISGIFASCTFFYFFEKII